MLSSSSSSGRDISPAPENVRPKSIGCMSSIFQLAWKFNNRRRFLTSGKNQEKKSTNLQPSSSSSSPQEKCPNVSSSDVVLRSPTLPQDMRLVCQLPPPALVARLMGLDNIPIPTVELAVAEKRRKLLGALKKCDEDLKALKRMIEVVKSVGDNNNINSEREKGELEEGSHAPAVLMLDEFTRFAFCGCAPTNGGELQQRKKKPGEEDIINRSMLGRIKRETMYAEEERNTERFGWGLWSSKAMVESVNEVCRDIDWGLRRENGRIGLALQQYICRDLIEETVREIGFCCVYPPLPLESCKRRLCF